MLHESSEPDPQTSAQAPGGARPAPKVLLVVSDAARRAQAAVVLRAAGFEVDEHADDAAALKALRRRVPDALLVEAADTAGHDGAALCQRVRALPGCAELPIVMLVAPDSPRAPELAERALQAGATDFFIALPTWTLLAARLRFVLHAARLRRHLRASRARLIKAQRIARMGSFEWNLRTRRLDHANGCARVLGFEPHVEHLDPRGLVGLIHPDERDAVLQQAADAVRAGLALELEFRARGVDGAERVLRLVGEVEHDAQGPSRVAGMLQDVTEPRRAEEQLQRLTRFDALTGLPNRCRFIERCEQALAEAGLSGSQVGLLTVDIDRFEHVNDALGHAAGDELLCEVARRLRAVVREAGMHTDQAGRDTAAWPQVARIGADEFVIVVPRLRAETDLEGVAQQVFDALREPLRLGGEQVFVDASMGAAVHPRDGADVSALLAHAHVALLAVKARGGGGLGGPAARGWIWIAGWRARWSAASCCCTGSPRSTWPRAG